jgi:nucleoside-diphosphate-sugar epimerase
MNIVVTGAAGFIGSHLCERLAALGHAVEGIDCFSPFYDARLKQDNAASLHSRGVTIHKLDLAEDHLDDILSRVEAVYHCAAQPGLSSSSTFDSYVRNNLTATFRLLESAARAPRQPRLINIATSSVYGATATGPETSEPRPTSFYGVTKLAAEQLALAYGRDRGLPVCSLRLFSVYGPRERPDKLYPRLIRSLLLGTSLPLFEGSEQHRRSYTYVDDIVDGLVAVLERWDSCQGEIFNIGNDQAITTGRGIRIVEDIIGHPVKAEHVPRRSGDQLATQADITKARKVLSYNPTTAPEEGLRKTVAWYREYLGRTGEV